MTRMGEKADIVLAELFSEGWLFAALLDMVIEHCGTGEEHSVKSFGWGDNARAMQLLAEAGYIDITGSCSGDDIEAVVSPSGYELLRKAEAAGHSAVGVSYSR